VHFLRKIGDEVLIVYNPRKEHIEVGENLRIFDTKINRGIIVQVIDLSLIDLAGILEDIVRLESIGNVKIEEYKPPQIEPYLLDVKNMKVCRGKIIKEIVMEKTKEKFVPWTGWIPDRSVKINPVNDAVIMKRLKLKGSYPIKIGKTVYSKADCFINAYNLQGINIIVGKKGAGKSHIGKVLLLGLINNGAKAIVFDINDEYKGLRFTKENKKSEYYDRIIPLNPGKNMRFTWDYVGLDVIYETLTTVMNLPDASAYTLRNIWIDIKKEEETIRYSSIIEKLEDYNPKVSEAILRRLDQIRGTKLLTESPKKAISLEDELRKLKNGGAIVVNLKAKSIVEMAITVQTTLSKLRSLLESGEPPLWIFAEEAHLYLNTTTWEDIVTRMRHLGAYQIYLTNSPTMIPETIIRQADNLFLFHLSTNYDLKYIAPASKLDSSTIIPIANALPPRRCLVIGTATKDFPLIIDTIAISEQTAGETRLFFNKY